MHYIQVHTPFKLLLSPNDKPIPFAVGVHGPVDEEIADHWYTRQHSRKLKLPEGTVPDNAQPVGDPDAAPTSTQPAPEAAQVAPEPPAAPEIPIPDDWNAPSTHWMKRLALAKALGAPPEVGNNEQCIGYITSIIQAREEAAQRAEVADASAAQDGA